MINTVTIFIVEIPPYERYVNQKCFHNKATKVPPKRLGQMVLPFNNTRSKLVTILPNAYSSTHRESLQVVDWHKHINLNIVSIEGGMKKGNPNTPGSGLTTSGNLRFLPHLSRVLENIPGKPAESPGWTFFYKYIFKYRRLNTGKVEGESHFPPCV